VWRCHQLLDAALRLLVDEGEIDDLVANVHRHESDSAVRRLEGHRIKVRHAHNLRLQAQIGATRRGANGAHGEVGGEALPIIVGHGKRLVGRATRHAVLHLRGHDRQALVQPDGAAVRLHGGDALVRRSVVELRAARHRLDGELLLPQRLVTREDLHLAVNPRSRRRHHVHTHAAMAEAVRRLGAR